MKKIFLFIIIGMALAQVSMAQDSKPEITFYTWDGNKALNDDDSLEMIVGETKELKYVISGNYDKESLTLRSEMDGNNPCFIIEGNTVNAWKAVSGNVGLYRIHTSNETGEVVSELLKSVKISANYRESGLLPRGKSDGNVYYSIDANWRLLFWVEKLDGDKLAGNTNYYEISDFSTPQDAPWYKYRNSIKEIVLNNIDRVGDYAFCDMSKIHYVRIMDNIKYLGNYVFYGCTNLTLEVTRFDPNVVYGPSLKESNPDVTSLTVNSLVLAIEAKDTIRPDLIIVSCSNYDFQGAAYNIYSGKDAPGNQWSKCGAVSPGEGKVNDTNLHWSLGQSDTLGTVCMTIDNLDPANPIGIPDCEEYGWEKLGNVVKDLHITDGISYIGNCAFQDLTGIQSIQFNQHEHPLDSIHYEAFSSSIRPWKFAMGDPRDGAVRPPKMIGCDPENESSLKTAIRTWRALFKDTTVLYVPDSLVDDGKGGKIKCVELYRNDSIWGKVFNRITDRTVDTVKTDTTVLLKWLPQEKAHGYIVTVWELNCLEGECDTATIFIPATGLQGLVDWSVSKPFAADGNIAARRMPQEDEHGGMTLTISIKTGSGETHNEDVEVEVSGMKSKQEYAYTRTVLGDGTEKYNKAGVFLSPDKSATSLEEINPANEQAEHKPMVHIYDLLGRPMGASIDALPEGIYIMDNGQKRTTILLHR